MKKINILIVAALTAAFAACSDGETLTGGTPGTGAPIIDVPAGANPGEIMVKFKPGTTDELDQAQTRAKGSVMTRSGLSEVDETLMRIGVSHLERVFPVDVRTEERAREAGLNLWYVIRFDETTDLQLVAKELAKLGDVAKVQYSRQLQRTYNPAVKPALMSEATRATLQAISAGRTRAADGDLFFNDPGLPAQWGYINTGHLLSQGIPNKHGEEVVPAVQGADVNCRQAWELCAGDPSIIVAVFDEGVMWNHPDLKANMWVNEAETYASAEDADGNGYAGDRYGYNFVEDRGFISCTDPNDVGHGTHVAGTIAAVNGNGEGVCGVAGGDGTPGSGVKIMSCQIFAGDRGASSYQEARAMKYAADNGAVVMQCSWGVNSALANPLKYQPGFLTDEEWIKAIPLEKEALDYFVHNAGSPNGVIDGGIVVFAGGNEYAAMAAYPAAYPEYISVAALAADGTPSSYTNYATGIRISAPGGDSFYHKCDEGMVYSTLPPTMGDYYGYMEGTSMACPHVSGVVALGLSYAAKLHRHFRAEDFRKMVLESVSDASLESYFTDTKLYYMNYPEFGPVAPMPMEPSTYAGKMGNGLIDAYKLLKAVEGGGVEMKVPNMFVGVEKTTQINYTRYFNGGEGLTFTCQVADASVATMTSGDGVNFTLKGLKQGSTTATVTASNGQKQEFHITVRKGNGWL